MRTISILLLLLLQTTAYCQIKADSSYAIGQPIVIECAVPIPEGGKLNTIWETSEGLSSREFGDKLALWASAPGKYSVAATTQVTKELKLNGETYVVLVPDTFKKYTAEFTVVGLYPPKPEPDNPTPPPSPIAPDRFENIGQRVAKWVTEIPTQYRPKKTELARIYNELADGLEIGTFQSTTDSNAYFKTEKAKVFSTPELESAWTPVGTKIGTDLTTRKLTNRIDIIEYYRAVALGLK